MQTLLDAYAKKVADGDLQKDDHQARVVQSLQRLYDDLTAKKKLFVRPKPVKGLYIYGGVGRGKSMLMDMLFACLPDTLKKRRIHFHAFMIETHDWLHARRAGKAVDNLLPDYAKHVVGKIKLLCFDEFHVTDVADAMILSRLFTALLDSGVVVVATSNWPPDRLYEGGLQRERFLPFITLIKERLEIQHLDSHTDYRAEAVQDLETYLYPLNAQTKARADGFFHHFADGKPQEVGCVRVKGRDIPVHFAGGAARFTFAELCEHPHGAEDYIRIGERFHTVLIEGIPRLGYDRNNETKRLMTLIDVLYDMRRRVIITAESPPEKLYHGSDYTFEFDRTISRLNEMQSSSYTDAA